MILVMSTFQIVLKLPDKNVLFCSSCLYVKRRQGLVWFRQGASVYERCLFDVLTYGPGPVCAWASVHVCVHVQGEEWWGRSWSREKSICIKVKGLG